MAEPVIVVHTWSHAEAAIAAAEERGAAVVLASPRDGALTNGPAYYKAAFDAARRAHPTAPVRFRLDCGDDAAAALAALRIGFAEIGFHGRLAVAKKIADIARQAGTRLVRGAAASPRNALDLLDCDDPLAACRNRLAGRASSRD